MNILQASHLGKAYRVYPTRWARLIEWLDPRRIPRHRLHWVLNDISFKISPGEAVGIIGINGAGKSTLLKLITGTATPTTGQVTLQGRVAALLELGIGFHPDFTGRQNVLMAGQLLGYSADEVLSALPEIESFAGIGEYIDKPVRIYSSGMQVRLAFSVATFRRPDILIVDEALSVGDVQFQQKCISRIKKFRDQGTTILLVTHDIGALSAICERAIVLSHGSLAFDGTVSRGIEIYFASFDANRFGQEPTSSKDLQRPTEFIKSFDIENRSGIKDLIFEGESVNLKLHVKNLRRFNDPHVGIRIQDRYGTIVFETNTFCQGINLRKLGEDYNEFKIDIRLNINLGKGEYTLAVGIANEGHESGQFKSVILPTQIIHKFNVARESLQDQHWAGITNLYPSFSVSAHQHNH